MTFQEELRKLGERSGERSLTEAIISAYGALVESVDEDDVAFVSVFLHAGDGNDAVPLSKIKSAIVNNNSLTMRSANKNALLRAKEDIDDYFNPYYVQTGEVLEENGTDYWALTIKYDDIFRYNKAQSVKLYNMITDYVNAGPSENDAKDRESRQVMGESVNGVPPTTGTPDSRVYVSADGTQVLGLTWGDDPQNVDPDPDIDDDDPDSNAGQGYDCYTYADLYDVDDGFDLSRLPANPWDLDSLEGRGLSLVANLEQRLYRSSELPTEEDALGVYVNPDEGWKAVEK